MKQLVLRACVITAAMLALGAMFSARSSDAAIHEIVAAYCSGGDVGVIGEDGHLEPPAISDPASPAFAKPVLASGAVDLATLTVTDHPNTKFEEGSSVFALDSTNVDHASAEHCPNNALP